MARLESQGLSTHTPMFVIRSLTTGNVLESYSRPVPDGASEFVLFQVKERLPFCLAIALDRLFSGLGSSELNSHKVWVSNRFFSVSVFCCQCICGGKKNWFLGSDAGSCCVHNFIHFVLKQRVISPIACCSQGLSWFCCTAIGEIQFSRHLWISLHVPGSGRRAGVTGMNTLWSLSAEIP